MSGFTKIRNGLLEHVDAGMFSATDLGIYAYLQLRCCWATAICMTNAVSIATTFSMPTSTTKDCFRRLREHRYIDYPDGTGKRGNYPVLLLKGEPTDGVLRGSRLMSRADNDFSAVVYEFPSADRLQTVLRASSDRPEGVLWASADRLLTVPLLDLLNRSRLAEVKTYKTRKTRKTPRSDAQAQGRY